MTEKPTPQEIGHFIDKVHRIDRHLATNHYVRTGESMRDAPDHTVIKVLDWLETLRADQQSGSK